MRAIFIAAFILSLLATIKASAQTAPDFLVEAYVDNVEPFVGQQINYIFRLYIRSGRTNRGSIVSPGFEGFWRQDDNTIVESTEARNGEIYRVRQSRTILYPTETGSLTIEPTTFVVPRDAFNPGEVQFTEALSVQVQPLPETTTLVEGFSGLVGQVEIVQVLDRQEINVGEPLKLQLTIRGTGNIEQVPFPKFVPTDIWRVYTNSGTYEKVDISSGQIIGQKTFEWLLTPSAVGQLDLPEMIFSYFDLTTLQFQPVKLTPITIDVRGDPEEIAPIPTQLANVSTPVMRSIPASIALGSPISFLLNVLFIAFWVVPPIGTLFVWRHARNRRLRLQNRVYYRQTEALGNALQKLGDAHKQLSVRSYYPLIQTAIMAFFADKLDREASGLDYDDIGDAMRYHNIEPTTAAAILACLHEVDETLYMPFNESDASDTMIANRAAQLLTEIDAQWAGK